MPKDVDARKQRKALRKIRKAAEMAEKGLGPALSDWEIRFLEEVEARIETYGSAFHDPEKGQADDALSALQQIKLHEIDRKARGKSINGFARKRLRPKKTDHASQETMQSDPPSPSSALQSGLHLVKTEATRSSAPASRSVQPVKLRLVKGGTNVT